MDLTTNQPSVFPLTLTLFGPMQVFVGDRPLVSLRSRKTLWLLALLVLRHERPVEREWLAGTLWPDANPEQSLSSLRSILSELRKALAERLGMRQSPTRHTLRLSLHNAAVDVLAFDAAVASNALPALEQAAALYQGPLLEGCAEEWVGQEREARDVDCLRALMTLGEAAQAAGGYRTAAGYFRRAAALDPWRDGARRGLMEALETFRELGNKQGTAWTLNDLGKVAGAQDDLNTARTLYRECISLQRELGDRRGISAGLRGLAAALPETPETATRLWAAADALRESIGARLPPHEQELYDKQVEQTRRLLSEETFITTWATGRTMTWEEAAAYALDERLLSELGPMPQALRM